MKRSTDPHDLPAPRGAEDESPEPVQVRQNARAYTITGNGKFLPIVWGTAKVGALLLEVNPPEPFSAPAWQSYPTVSAYNYGTMVTNGGNTYVCTQSGQPAGSGGPTGTGFGIVDNAAKWDYVTGGTTLYKQDFVAALAEGCEDLPHSYGDAVATILFWDKEQIGPNSTNVFYRMFPGAGPVQVAIGSQTTARGASHETTGYPHSILLYTDSGHLHGLPSGGTQRELPALAAELQTTRFGYAISSRDCNPADIVNDLLTHTRRGCGWDPTMVDDSITGAANNTFRTYCDAAGLALSVAIDQPRTAMEILVGILNATNSVGFWSGGTLRIVPLGDAALAAPGVGYPTGFPVAGYGTTPYSPPVTANFDFTHLKAGHFLDEQQPIRVTVRPDEDCFNVVPVQFFDRSQGYAQTSVEDADQADVAIRGARRAPLVDLPVIFADGTQAVLLSRILAQRSSYVTNTYTWRCAWNAGLLRELAEIVSLTEPEMGFNGKLVRITEITEAEDGTFEITAEDFDPGSGHAAAYAPQANDATPANVIKTTAAI